MTLHEQASTDESAGVHAPALAVRRLPRSPRAAVLFLHGGRSDSRAPSRPWHLAAVRMKPFVRAVARATPDDDVLLAEVRYRVRGWNGGDADALRDARRALEELQRLAPDVPVVLVGHSMGGRAALRAAGAPQVHGVLALAPWCPEGEPVAQLREKEVVVLHGDRDRVTDPRLSKAFAHRARAAGARAAFVDMVGGDHAMLRHAGDWHRTAVSTVLQMVPPAAETTGVTGTTGATGATGVSGH
ncbi:alpha/beta fold hydrolase [Streptomyces sp. BH-SS-21]|uniref:Alpha/beta fold hydrolase n=1 Tax=Streptomyces liliiviolaceus TaxID=2823109 RepID=A0A940Y2G9_9ACTN|nr:alpha/beta fold hydrolase [Streptomyces liliiviolaceus]MBQ0851175.1 alpha/beta fold hydrolase [Streptomyces liliiviolaceus]